MWRIFLRNFTSISNFPEKSILARSVALSQTVYTTIVCRLSKMFRLPEIPFCTFVNAATVVAAVSDSLRITLFYPVITVSPADWWLRSSTLLKR